MATMASLFGLDPAPPRNCRVLEIACADGGNLIPMACELPGSTFLGFDLVPAMVEKARFQIDALGLTNIRIEQLDLMDATRELGEFDYVIAHGLYSWAPEPVRDRLMHIAHELLAPHGVAYISFNALPGCRIRQMFREMLLIHLRNVTEPEERIRQAREFLKALTLSQERTGDMGSLLRIEAEFLLEQGPVILFHDELGEVYHPVYIHEFIAHAARFGLQYLSEAHFPDMQPPRFPPEVLQSAGQWAAGDRVTQEMYFDFLRGRTFRRVLLCRDNLSVAPGLIAARIRNFSAASPAQPVSKRPDISPQAVEEFRGPLNSSAKTAHPLAKAALLTLTERWPESLSFENLLAACSALTGAPPDPDGLTQILYGTFAAGLVELHACPPRCVSKPGPFPETTALARWQAQRGERITTLRHTTIEAKGEVEQRLLMALDGTRDLSALVEELSPLLPETRDDVASHIRTNLERLARFGLLVH